jgi:PKHD-type hydroxylase
MLLVISSVLTQPEVAAVQEAAADLDFVDGRITAGRYAATVKSNDQASPSPGLDALRVKVRAALAAHPVFQSAARPKAMTPLILSRYREGQTYGLHIDDALMGSIRTDLSFTLFLSAADTYDGGALIIEDLAEARAFKPDAGDLILYPSTSLHRVAPVTRGTRLAMVGWVQSWIRDAGQREILFDLDRSIEEVHARDGKSGLFDTLAKTRSNLLRIWVGR